MNPYQGEPKRKTNMTSRQLSWAITLSSIARSVMANSPSAARASPWVTVLSYLARDTHRRICARTGLKFRPRYPGSDHVGFEHLIQHYRGKSA